MARPDCISRVSHRRKEPVAYDSIKSGGIRERAMRAIEGRGEDRERTAASIASVPTNLMNGGVMEGQSG
jgi:hypothetical protein